MIKSGRNKGLTRRNMNDGKRGLSLYSPTKENDKPNVQPALPTQEKTAADVTQQMQVAQVEAPAEACVTPSVTEIDVQQLHDRITSLEAELIQVQKLKLALESTKAQVEIEKLQQQEEAKAASVERNVAIKERNEYQNKYESVDRAHSELQAKYTQKETEFKHLQAQSAQLQAEVKSVANARMSLESQVENLRMDNANINNNFAAYKSHRQSVEQQMQMQVSRLESELASEKAQLTAFQQQVQQDFDQEKIKFRILIQEHDQLRKEYDSKARKLERMEEFVNITKEMNSSLQAERDQLKQLLSTEKETTTRLHSLVSATTQDTSSLEMQVKEAEIQTRLANTQLLRVQCNLFFNLGLALKLDRLHCYGQICNVSLQKLWEDVQTLGVDQSQWSVFINAALNAAAQDSEASLVIN